MASTGESVSYAEYEARTNRLAHLLRARGLGGLDHYAIFMENNDRYLEACGAGERAGLYYTCVNSYLTAPELAYILNNSTAKFLITSRACREVALEAARGCPGLTSGLIVDGTGDDGIFADFEEATRAFPGTPISDESLGTPMLYSSGTTGRPRGSCGPWRTSRPVTSSPYSASCPGCGNTGTGSPTSRPPRCITRRPRPRSTWPSATAGRWSSWRNSIPSSTCAWSNATG